MNFMLNMKIDILLKNFDYIKICIKLFNIPRI